MSSSCPFQPLLHPLLLPGASFLTALRLPARPSCISSPTQHPKLVSLSPSPLNVPRSAHKLGSVPRSGVRWCVLVCVWKSLSMNSDRQKASVGGVPPQDDKEPDVWVPGPCQGHLQRETGTEVKRTTGDPVRRPIAHRSSRRAALAGPVSAVTLLLGACPCFPFL